MRPLRLLVAVLLVLAATSACGGGATTGDKGFVVGNGIITELPVAQRKVPGEVRGTTLRAARST